MGVDPLSPFQAIQRFLVQRQGLDLSRYKESYLRRRFLVRMRALKLKGLEEYARYLLRHPGEVEPLQRALSIKVTSFFRNRSCFVFLREKVVPALLARHAGSARPISVWSAGCATGEETYSVAALFAEASGRSDKAPVRVLGTDVDESALEHARSGSFPAEAFHRDALDAMTGFFETGGDGTVRPVAGLRRLVSFARESLLDPFDRSGLDLILCRNVLIYFSLDHQETILSRFAQALSARGFLVLGRVERLFGEARNLFDVASARDRVYRRTLEGSGRSRPRIEAASCG